MPPRIISTAEPFFFPGSPEKGNIGCLLVHGFTGSPKEMGWMGEFLVSQGYSVLGIRLPGHATRPEDMLRTRWEDWLAAVEDGWHFLNGATTGSISTFTQPPRQAHIFLIGLSMGGVLSLTFASQPFSTRRPVAGVVAMSTPYALRPDPRLSYLKLLRWLQPSIPKGPPDWRDLEAARDHVDYPYYPTRAIVELKDLLVEMRATLPLVTVPVLLMHSRSDTDGSSFDPHSMQEIYDHLSTRDKHLLWIEDCGHVITREPQRQQVFQAANEFIARVAGCNP